MKYYTYAEIPARCLCTVVHTKQYLSFTHSLPSGSIFSLPVSFASPDNDGKFQGSSTNQSSYLVLRVENTEDALPHLARLLAGINLPPDASLLVVLNNRGGLCVVCRQTLVQGIGVVVGALDQGLTGDIVLHVSLRRVEDLVVRPSGSRVDQTASNSCDQEGVVNLQFDSVLKLLVALRKHVIQTLSLGNGTGETVENETVFQIFMVSYLPILSPLQENRS